MVNGQPTTLSLVKISAKNCEETLLCCNQSFLNLKFVWLIALPTNIFPVLSTNKFQAFSKCVFNSGHQYISSTVHYSNSIFLTSKFTALSINIFQLLVINKLSTNIIPVLLNKIFSTMPMKTIKALLIDIFPLLFAVLCEP